MQRKTRRAAVVAAGALAASFLGAGAAGAAPDAPTGGCHAFAYIDESAVATCDTSQPGTVQVVIECTNTEGEPIPVTIFGPGVPAEAGQQSVAQCDAGNKRTNYYYRTHP